MSRSILALLALLVLSPTSESPRAGMIHAGDGPEATPALAVEAGRVLGLQRSSLGVFRTWQASGSGPSFSDALETAQGEGSRSFDPYWVVADPPDAEASAVREYYSLQDLEQSRSLVASPGVPEPTVLALLGLALGTGLALRRGEESGSLGTIPLPPAIAGRRAEFHFAARRDERPFSARPISVQSGFRATITTMRVVPEPTTLALLGAAFAALLAARAVRAGAGP